MPARSKITRLPEKIRIELEKRLIAGGFGDYSGITAWLNDELDRAGEEESVSRTAVARFGQAFENKISAIKIATEQARAVAEASADDEGAMNEALIRLVQQKAFDVLVNLEDEEGLPRLGVMIAKLSKASVDQKKWQADVKKKAEKAFENIEEKLKAQKLDPEALRVVREEIYGIV